MSVCSSPIVVLCLECEVLRFSRVPFAAFSSSRWEAKSSSTVRFASSVDASSAVVSSSLDCSALVFSFCFSCKSARDDISMEYCAIRWSAIDFASSRKRNCSRMDEFSVVTAARRSQVTSSCSAFDFASCSRPSRATLASSNSCFVADTFLFATLASCSAASQRTARPSSFACIAVFSSLVAFAAHSI